MTHPFARSLLLASVLALGAVPLVQPAFADKLQIYTPAFSNLAVGG